MLTLIFFILMASNAIAAQATEEKVIQIHGKAIRGPGLYDFTGAAVPAGYKSASVRIDRTSYSPGTTVELNITMYSSDKTSSWGCATRDSSATASIKKVNKDGTTGDVVIYSETVCQLARDGVPAATADGALNVKAGALNSAVEVVLRP